MYMEYFVYILASKKNGTLYVGFTGELKKRVYEHRMGVVDGFTKRYHVHRLVHFEMYDDPNRAIEREKNIKEWKRIWKIELIEKNNPCWDDLYDDI